jgi:phosphate/sulfate permease
MVLEVYNGSNLLKLVCKKKTKINRLISKRNYFSAGSWFASPALAGIISVAVFIFIRKFILEKVKISL